MDSPSEKRSAFSHQQSAFRVRTLIILWEALKLEIGTFFNPNKN